MVIGNVATFGNFHKFADVVSVPLRGNGYRKFAKVPDYKDLVEVVSVPLRGNGYRKSWGHPKVAIRFAQCFRPLAG